jgi:exonuclease VII large subunit
LLGGTSQSTGSGLGEEISRQIEASLRAIDLQAVGEQISAEMERAMSQLRTKLESVEWDRVGQRTQRSMERAMERMQREIDRATEKAARRQEKLERMADRAAREKERMERVGRRMADHPPVGTPFDKEPDKDLDQERLAILKMVEGGQISPAEAEKLLDALE